MLSNLIRWGDRLFTEPAVLAYSLPAPTVAGLYMVMTFDPAWTPLPYRPIYAGKTSDFSDRVGYGHEKYSEWLRSAGYGSTLYISFHAIASDYERSWAEQQLFDQYHPPCNRNNPSVGLSTRYERGPVPSADWGALGRYRMGLRVGETGW